MFPSPPFDTRFAIVPMVEQIPRLLATILKAREDPDHKIIVFFVAARIVQASKLIFFCSSLVAK